MTTFYLICFVLGFVLSVLAAFTGLGRFHLGHIHMATHTHSAGHSGVLSALNGITLPAFLCLFGGTGYLLHNYSRLVFPLALLVATLAGLGGASVMYVLLFRLLMPRERVLQPEDTRMDGVVGRVSNEIRVGGTGEILFSQTGARRGAAARSETGEPIARGTEVVVLRYARGIAYVSPLEEVTRWGEEAQR